MTKNNKGRSGGDRPTPKTTDSPNHTQIASLIGWRGAMAAGNGQFRINGTYDAVAPTRTIKRRIERMLAKQRGRR
jgi:hypothetical protein